MANLAKKKIDGRQGIDKSFRRHRSVSRPELMMKGYSWMPPSRTRSSGATSVSSATREVVVPSSAHIALAIAQWISSRLGGEAVPDGLGHEILLGAVQEVAPLRDQLIDGRTDLEGRDETRGSCSPFTVLIQF